MSVSASLYISLILLVMKIISRFHQ